MKAMNDLNYKKMQIIVIILMVILPLSFSCEDEGQIRDSVPEENNLPEVSGYPIVGTGQTKYYNNDSEIAKPSVGEDFYGQDASYQHNSPQYVDNGDGTVTDMVTGLMWSQSPDLNGDGDIDYQDKLTYSEALSKAATFDLAGYDDWRAPTIKELQSLVDYDRSPATSNSPAIDPVFGCTQIINEAGEADYAYYWSGTTHANNMPGHEGRSAAYMSFGKALGYMDVFGGWVDVHGAGAQRSDPKAGSIDDYPYGHGPQGDAIRINNFVRLVRNIN